MDEGAPQGQGLTLEQQREIEELESLASSEVGIPFVEEEWDMLAPNVWTKTESHTDGGRSVALRIEGLTALEWASENLWLPRLQQVEAALTAPHSLTNAESQKLSFEQENLLARLSTLDRWHQYEAMASATLPGIIQPQACSPSANASAMPTTAQPGAKAYGNSRSCVTEAWSQAAVTPPYTVQNVTAPIGQLASASLTAYGPNCASFAHASAPPLYEEDVFDC